jgi:hypothetical protein
VAISLTDAFLVAGTTTAVFAAMGFNRPSWIRTFATAACFRTALVGHIVLYLVLLLVEYALFVAGVSLYRYFDPVATVPTKTTLIWVALALTLAVRATPALADRVRATMHRLAGIPDRAYRFGTVLADTDLHASEAVAQETRDYLASLGIDAEQDWLPVARPTHRLLFKATALFVQLRRWEDDDRFAGFMVEAKNDYSLLRRRFDRLVLRVSRTLKTIERLGEVRHLYVERGSDGDSSADFDEMLKRMVSDLISDNCEDISAFHDDACLFAARGAMSTQSARAGRDAMVSRLGFGIRQRPKEISYGSLAGAAVLLYVGIWLCFLVLPTANTGMKLKDLVNVVSLIVLGSIAIPVVPKLRWGFANAGLRGKTPVSFVLGAGIVAALFAVLVNLVAGALLLGGMAGAWTRLQAGAPYLPSVVTTSVTFAWLIQDHRWQSAIRQRGRRWRDAMTLGGAWLVMSALSALLVASITDKPVDSVELLLRAIIGLGFGALLGFVIPESVRVHYLRAEHYGRVPSVSHLVSPATQTAAA